MSGPPYRCPACLFTITITQPTPRKGVVYRCPTCRLELVYHPKDDLLVVRAASAIERLNVRLKKALSNTPRNRRKAPR